jgi:hypothetical protein
MEGAIPMTAGQSTRHLSRVSIAPAPLAALLAATLVGGSIIGAGITLQLGSTDTNSAAIGAPARAAATFDAVKFRAEEHAALLPQAEFDAVKFRAEEHAALVTKSGPGGVTSEQKDRKGGK